MVIMFQNKPLLHKDYFLIANMLALDCYNHNKQQQLEKLVQLNLYRLLNAGLFFYEFF